MNDEITGWHLDKRVPIALILVMLTQFAGIILYVGALSAKVDDSTRRIGLLEAQKISERLVALEAQVSDAKALLLRVETKIDRLSERR